MAATETTVKDTATNDRAQSGNPITPASVLSRAKSANV
jgi:hypothetical protein